MSRVFFPSPTIKPNKINTERIGFIILKRNNSTPLNIFSNFTGTLLCSAGPYILASGNKETAIKVAKSIKSKKFVSEALIAPHINIMIAKIII